MMAKNQKNQFPAYALKSDDGENEEHWNQVNYLLEAHNKVTPLQKAT